MAFGGKFAPGATAESVECGPAESRPIRFQTDPLPKINGNAGRDHWPNANSCLLAGGGMTTGQVIGSTNLLGEVPADRPVHYRDVFSTLYHNMGIDARQLTLNDLRGRPQYLVDQHEPIAELI